MSSKRRRFPGELKAKVALEALRGDRTSMDAPGGASIFWYGLVHAVRCCRLSGLVDCGTSGAAGPYGDTRVGSKSLQRACRLCVRVLVFPTPSR